MNPHKAAVFLLCLAAVCRAGADIVLEPPVFHGAARSALYRENWPEDNGGVVYCFLRNTGASPDRVAELLVNGLAPGEWPKLSWWRVWPESLAPGGTGCLTLKATGDPFAKGSTAELALVMDSGAQAAVSFPCETPALRLANALPAPEPGTLLLYLRNDGETAAEVRRVLLNSREWAPGVDAGLSAVGGSYTVPPGGLLILELAHGDAPAPGAPLNLRILADAGETAVRVGAGIRLTAAEFPIGTWSSNMIQSPGGQRHARRLGIDACVSYTDWPAQEAMFANYHIRTLNICARQAGDPPQKEPDTEQVAARAGAAHIAAWMVRDEPDLHGIPAARMLDHALDHWRHDPDTPAYLNLMSMSGFNEYGPTADIACMDHYVMHAPNAIPRTGITRHARLEEALEYTDQLKANTEPVRMWTWAQLAAPVWGRQPENWGVKHQFWSHVMGGAKGILWFKYGPDYERDHPEQIRAAENTVRAFNAVRTLCFYGEPLAALTSDDPEITGRLLISRDAVVVVVLNNNYTTGLFPFRSSYTLKSSSGTVSFPLPGWVPPERAAAVTAAGLVPVEPVLKDGTVSLRVSINGAARVFLIGRQDVQAPDTPGRVVIAGRDEKGATLSWPVPRDNCGVFSYEVLLNGEPVDTTPFPVYTAAMPGAYTVRARDAAGNASPPTEPVLVAF